MGCKDQNYPKLFFVALSSVTKCANFIGAWGSLGREDWKPRKSALMRKLSRSLFGVRILLQFRQGSVFRGKLLPTLTRNRALRPRRSPLGLVSQCPIVRATVFHVASQHREANTAAASGALTF